ncbi:hypothetical protein [Xanthomonas dyei]|jgi:hypothetical protein|uniref:hypothetical protein n=1 Tax=Xanthomonas dyei TaxID=743699 RepID=UPI001E3D303A|nr:hypothetical protein [Xanthomonas dyei]
MSRRCNGRSIAASLSCLHAVNGDDVQVAAALPNNPGMLAVVRPHVLPSVTPQVPIEDA